MELRILELTVDIKLNNKQLLKAAKHKHMVSKLPQEPSWLLLQKSTIATLLATFIVLVRQVA